MANSAQAIKRARQAQKHSLHNQSQKSEARTAIKKTLKALNGSNGNIDLAEVKSAYKNATTLLDRLAKRNIIHHNKAARIKRRLNKKIKAAATSTAAA